MKTHSNMLRLAFLLASLEGAALLLGCPPGTKTSMELGVTATVDPTHCTEVKGDAGLVLNTSSDVALDCTTITGSGVVRIVFPRKSWWDIKLASSPGSDPGPGK